ncbi:hypothetical protein [Aquidulcibacter paucihalophilus]|uniref:hypothetical protein n=1 Tax=Aquidulcibacter paucihalophilus TaxID=1978549 RepID=UPI000A18ADCE|nr:hypothetical protein [Aquidulcibacter paucihalophilus]
MFAFSFSKSRFQASLAIPTLLFLMAAAPVTPPPTPQMVPHLMAGQWQVSQSMNMGPDADQIQTRTACYSDASLQTDALAPFKPEPPPGREAVKCQTQNVVIEGDWIRLKPAAPCPLVPW